jgi:ABC-2 type transport system permease protein
MRMLAKLIRDEWIKVLAFTILMSMVSVVQVLFWPNVKRLIPLVVDQMPDFFKGLVGGIATEGFVFYIITQQLIKNVVIFGSGLAILLGASAVAREREAGTLELLLAQPISRARVLAEKFTFSALSLAIPVLVSSMLAWPAAFFVDEAVDPIPLLVASLYCYLVLLVIFAFTFALGVVIDEQMKVLSASLGACIVMMLLVIFEQTKPFSIYGYIYPEVLRPIFVAGSVPYALAFSMAAIGALLFWLSLLMFRKRTI